MSLYKFLKKKKKKKNDNVIIIRGISVSLAKDSEPPSSNL